MAPIGNAVYATLLMNDGYLPGAMVLGHSLRDRGAKGKLVALAVMEELASTTIAELQTVYDEVVPIKQIRNKTPANLYLMDRPDLVSTFTKIELWRQLQYSRIVYLDADMVALRAPNELLTMETQFAAVPDIGWPDCFNSGMMVLNPNMADYYALLALAERGISFDGADQGLLNMHFTDWDRLGFKYNCTPSGNYQYLPAFRHFQSSINLIHFIGRDKPWTLGRNSRRATGIYSELLARWWAVYDRHYRGQQVVYYSGQWQSAPKKVQDYVSGEETLYLPAYQAPKNAPSATYSSSKESPQPTHQPATAAQTQLASTHSPAPAIEQGVTDQPTVEEQIQHQDYTPTPTVQQRKWSAPHTEWEPAKAPPPANARPEAVNFPSTVYEMSEDKQLFRPPASYPEAPKDMWYEVPAKVESTYKPKQIFPWESRAPKPTRVFAEPTLPSPPPELELPPVDDELATSPGTASPLGPTESEGSTDITEPAEPVERQKEAYVDPWTTFNQRTNAWDDMPEITRYMQSITQAKKAKIQVLHHTPSTTTHDHSTTPDGRRHSLRVTDFPTEIERPSLPVTPAPRKRSILWGDETEEVGILPNAEGVPKQAEWNPVAQLEDLRRRQSEALMNKELAAVREPPKRDLPDTSRSKEDVIRATEKAMSPGHRGPLKPILKEPSFEVPGKKSGSSAEPSPQASKSSLPFFHDATTAPTSSPATGSLPPKYQPIGASATKV